MFLHEKSLGKNISNVLSIKSSRSAPIIINNKFSIFNSKSIEQNNSSTKKFSLLLNVKSTGAFHDHTNAKNNQQELDAMNKIVDQTDHDLRRALEHANLRHEQLDELEFRSEEMLSKNENLVFGNIIRRFDLSEFERNK